MKQNFNILLVEDDPNDVYFLMYAFEEAGLKNPINVVEDGQLAVDYLSGVGEFADRADYPIPYLILLDLKLPKVMGLDVLRWINSRPELCMALVIILTSSNDAADVADAYKHGARSYLVKPHSLSERLELAKCIKSYWIELNEPPPSNCAPPPWKLPGSSAARPADSESATQPPAAPRKRKRQASEKMGKTLFQWLVNFGSVISL